MLATGGRDSSLTVWDVSSGKRLIRLPHPGWVQRLAFSPDGSELISGCADGLVRAWNWRTGELKRGLPHNRALMNYDFTNDRRWLVTLGSASLEVTDWRAGEPAAPELSLRGDVSWSIAVPAGDRRAIVSGYTGRIIGFDLEKMVTPTSASVDAMTRFAEIVAGRRITSQGNVVPISSAEWADRWEQVRLADQPLFRFGPD